MKRPENCRHWFMSLGVAALLAHGASQPARAEAPPPQHKATRALASDTTPMTVVPSTDTVNGKDWFWVPIDGAKCRHDTNTGIAVRLKRGASKVIVTMQGGGACFNGATCGGNMSEFDANDFQSATTTGLPGTKLFDGLWKLSSNQTGTVADAPNQSVPNPLADQYTEVFIPYCSGDMHVGARQNVYIFPLTKLQNFQGAKNTDLYYRYIVDKLLPEHTAPQLNVVLSGFSGGGFGAALTAGHLHDLLPTRASLTLIDDSGPLLQQKTDLPITSSLYKSGDPYDTLWRPCLQQRLHDTWGLSNSVLQECGPTCTASNWMNPSFDKLLRSHPDVFVSVISSTHDAVLRTFMALTVESSCLWDPSQAQYTDGLLKLRAQMKAARGTRNNVATYYISNDPTSHGNLQNGHYYSVTQGTGTNPVNSVRLQDWVHGLLGLTAPNQPTPPLDVGP